MARLDPDDCCLVGRWIDDICLQAIYETAGDHRRFLGHVDHELKNPLTIRVYGQMVRTINAALIFLVLSFAACAAVGETTTPPDPAPISSPLLATPLPAALSSPAHKTGQVVDLAIVGDVMLGRYVGHIMARRGTSYPFAPVKGLLAKADIALANLESPLTTAEQVAQGYDLRAEPSAVEALAEAGFDVVSLANNHCTDSGEEGLLETMAALEGAGIAHVGAGRHQAEARAPLMIEVKGVKLAFLAYDDTQASFMATDDRAGSAWLELERVRADIAKALDVADVVIVSLHWGREYSSHPTDRQRKVAQELAAAGADIVVGHHSHVLQSIQWLKNGDHLTLVAYSLGNFLFSQYFLAETREGAILRCLVDRDGLVGISIVPVVIEENGQVHLSSGAEGEETLKRILSDHKMPPWHAFVHAGSGYEEWWLANYSLNSPGELSGDLDGDGRGERVELMDGTLRLYDEQQEIWHSDPTWDVHQATFADADNDGGAELAFVLWKPFAPLPIDRFHKGPSLIEGNKNAADESCHLFIYGFQRGALRPRWCSSALPEPIHEFAFGDVDGDGRNELVVLEGSYDDEREAPARHVTIWRWNGWGFSLEWRSAAGRYHHLALEDISTDNVLDIVVQDNP